MSKFSRVLAGVAMAIVVMTAATGAARAAEIVWCDGDQIVYGPWEIPYYPPGTYYAAIIQNTCTLSDDTQCSYNYTESWQLVDGSWTQTNSERYNNTCPL